MAILDVLRDEFQTKRFGFQGIKSERFCMSQWRIPLLLYLSYRLVVLVYAVTSLAYLSTLSLQTPLPLAAYLTNWAFVTLTLYLIVHFLAASIFHLLSPLKKDASTRHLQNPEPPCCGCPSVRDHAWMFVENGGDTASTRRADEEDQFLADPADAFTSQGVSKGLPRPPIYLVVVWVLFDIVSVVSLMVTFVYFVFIFRTGNFHGSLSFVGIQVHVLNSVVVLLEHLITAVPYRLLHIVYPLLYMIVYMVFTILYWEGNHSRVIYPEILDWNNPGPTLEYVVLIGFVILPVIHVFLFLLYRAKRWVYERC